MFVNPIIHLWQPGSFHEEQYIIGNRDGLEQLQKLIQRALEKHDGKTSAEFSVSDGEGYTLIVRCTENIDKLAVPYSEPFAKENRETAIYPWTVNE